jgi:inorganic pyrophosphatase
MVSLALLAGLSVTALLPIMGQRDRPGAATAPRPLEKPLFRWLPWLGVALVGLAAAATLGPAHPAGRSTPLPWLSGAITALFVGQVAATVALALCCWLAPRAPASRTSPRAPAGRMIDRPVWLGMAPAVTAGLAWLLQDGIAAGVTLLVADRLGTPGPPADGSAGNPHTFAVAPPVLWAAATTVGLAGVILIVAAAWLLLRPSPSTAVAEQIKRAYRYQNLDAAPPGSARRRRADAIIRDWTRGTLVGTVEHLGGWLAIAVGIVVTAGVVLDLTTRPDFFGRSWRWPVTVGGWLLGGLVLVLFAVGRQAYASPAWRRTVGVLWDLGTFWPRATHPLAPPCYAERAVPDLLNRITYLVGTWEQPEEDAGWGRPPRDGDVLVSAYSQGSVIAAATVMQLSEQTCDRVRLLTYGSPLRRLYARFFPAYFGLDALGRLARLLGARPGENVVGARPGEDVASARWRNLHRPSDPVGGYIFQEFWPYEWADEQQRRQATQDQLEHHVDCALLDPAFDRAPGDSCYPPTYGHSAYPRDPAFAQAVEWLWRRGQDSRFDDVDWRPAPARTRSPDGSTVVKAVPARYPARLMIATGPAEEPTMEFDVTVEIPKGQRNKYEMDRATGRIRLDRTLFTATQYPADYGYIEGTLADTGDPLDALVLVREPTFSGCLIHCRAIGMFCMRDENGRDDKVLCVPAGDPRQAHLREIEDLSRFDRLEIQHFFEVYKALEPGKTVEGANWTGRAEAEAEIERSWNRCREAVHGS